MYTVYTERKVKKSGKIRDNDFKFSIKDVPFSRKFSLLLINEGIAPCETGAERKQLLFSRLLRSYNAVPKPVKPCLFSMRPMYNNDRSIPYVCVAIPSMLEIDTEYGYAQVCFENKDVIRIRGKGIGLRFYSKFEQGESLIPRLDGTYQFTFEMAGEYLFVPIKGRLDVDCDWKWKQGGWKDATIDIIPDENGEFELAIHYALVDAERFDTYRTFEECVEDAQRDYDEWYALYPPVPRKYADLKKLAAYSIWICYVAPSGILKDNIMLFDKTNSAFSWHQAYHAMAIQNNVDLSVQLMKCMFDYQDEYGEIPDLVDDQYINILATKPPFHGFALLYMMERYGDKMTAEHCKILYEPMVKWYNWWMTLRDTDNDGVPQYNHGCESGMDFTQMLKKGVPAECPDLIAYLVLLAEAIGKMAKKMGMEEEATEWQKRSEKLLDVLINEFWDGEKFIARLSSSHEIIEFSEVEALMPMMLGSRLPQDIIDKIAKTLADPEKYYTHAGFRSAPKRYVDGKFVPSYLLGFTQIKMIPGLYEAGKKELARDVLQGFLDMNLGKMPRFGYTEPDPSGKPAEESEFAATFGKCSSLASAIFIVLASYLEEISKK